MRSEIPLQPNFDELFAQALRLEAIFIPHTRKQREARYADLGSANPSARFVHYTSADAALKIIGSKHVWMRNTTCMADYREVQHGFEIMNRFYSDILKREPFYHALDEVSPGLAHEAVDLFDHWWQNIRTSTYIASISEHGDDEDLHGRLSMWRAFGSSGVARVAIVVRIPWRFDASEALNIMFSPVAYFKEDDAHAIFARVTANIKAESDFLRSIDRKMVAHAIFSMFVVGATCLKHEGFHEEREWRVIYGPERAPSPLMKSSIETVGGIPQIVYHLPLDASVDPVLADLDLAKVFDRLIIGQSQFSWPMYEAFVSQLKVGGVYDAEQRVFISNIPIRS
jgi:hypothetical protein